MIPGKETKLLTYQLMENNFVCLQELREHYIELNSIYILCHEWWRTSLESNSWVALSLNHISIHSRIFSTCIKHSVPQSKMGLMKSTKDAVFKVRQYVSSKLRISWVWNSKRPSNHFRPQIRTLKILYICMLLILWVNQLFYVHFNSDNT